MKVVDLSRGDQVTLFNTLAIEISSKCNRTCAFCPNSYFNRPDVYMPLDLIRKMLQELRDLRYKGRVEFYIYNEPTRDKRLPVILALTRLYLPSSCLMINTNGDYFKRAGDIWELFECGLNQMQINIYSHKERFDQAQSWVDQLGLDQKLSLYKKISPKARACQVVAKYGITKNTKDSELQGVNHLENRSGNIPNFRPPLASPLVQSCTKPFRLLNINYNGDGLLCCHDYYAKVTFGNVKTMSLVEIWNHPVLQTYRARLQRKDRHMLLCDVCDFKGGSYLHMVDRLVNTEAHEKAHPAPPSNLKLVSIRKLI